MPARPTYRVQIRPMDPILFGDNRLSRSGVYVTGTQEPSPLVFYGAIGGFVSSALSSSGWPLDLLGAKDDGSLMDHNISVMKACVFAHPDGQSYFPVPCSTKIGKRIKTVESWVPSSGVGLSSLPGGLRPLTGRDPRSVCSEALVWSFGAIRAFLSGTSCSWQLRPTDGICVQDIHAREDRVGVGMDYGTNVALEGKLFNRPYRRYGEWVDFDGHRRAWGYEAYWQPLRRLTSEEFEALGSICFLGGDRGRAAISLQEETAQPFGELLESVLSASASSRGFLAYLLAPASLGGGLPQIGGRSPIAAAIGKPLYFSGWNNACNCPRAICVAAPAGSVFFYEWLANEDRAALIRKYWLESVSNTYASAGFGRVLMGVWNADS